MPSSPSTCQNPNYPPGPATVLIFAWSLPVCMLNHSVVCSSATLWAIAYQAPLSMGFSRQEQSNPRLLWLLNYSQILYCWASRKVVVHLSSWMWSLSLLNTGILFVFSYVTLHALLWWILLASLFAFYWAPPSIWKVKVKSLSCVQLFVTPWTVAYQAPLSMGFPRQEYWSALPFPSPGDLPDPWLDPRSPTLQADALPSEPPNSRHPLIH